MTLVNETTICIYSFKSSCIIHGGVDDSQNLIFKNYSVLENTNLETIAFLLDVYDGIIHTNRHKPLSTKLGSKCEEDDLTDDLELLSLSDYFNELKHDKRLRFPNNVIPDLKTDNEVKALQLFVKVNLDWLTGKYTSGGNGGLCATVEYRPLNKFPQFYLPQFYL